jgi:hypothetical protein
MKTMYRGFEIVQEANGLYAWIDDAGRVHNGKVDMQGGYKTEDEACEAVNVFLRPQREAGS